ncbi:hypothetical protein D3C80_1163600 [compost metagenome]
MVIRLAAGVRDQATPIEQHQSIADTQVAKVDGPDIPAREIAAACAPRGVELHVAHLRDRAIKIVTADRSNSVDRLPVDARHRQGRRDLRSLNLRPDDDHFFDLGRLLGRRRCGLLSEGGARQGERRKGHQ